MRYLTRTYLLGMTFLLAACQHDDYPVPSNPNAISFEMQIEEIDTPLIRGTPIRSVTEMTNMGVFAYSTGSDLWIDGATTATSNLMHNQLVTQSGGVWSYLPEQSWPQGNTTLFAYAPHATASNGITVQGTPYTDAPTLQYTVPANYVNQPDLMVAVKQEDKNSGIVSMTMKHALAHVSFKVTGGGDPITKIALKGVSVSGTLNLDNVGGTPQWSGLAAATNTEYQSGINSSLIAGAGVTNATRPNGYLMMIPQVLGPDAKLVITVDGFHREVSLSGIAWEAGKGYVYNLTINTPTIIVGYFGGWNGTEYTKLLEVEKVMPANDFQSRWGHGVNTGGRDLHNTVFNIEQFKKIDPTLALFHSIKHCQDKGNGWYIPSFFQLTAIWIAYEAVPSKYRLSTGTYFSSAEESTFNARGIIFTNADEDIIAMGVPHKSSVTASTRCVRDVTP